MTIKDILSKKCKENRSGEAGQFITGSSTDPVCKLCLCSKDDSIL
jgi:hypothetical protein